jgi:hypothetical protein
MKFGPAFGLFTLAVVALVGDIVSVLTGHGTIPLLDSVVLAALTGGAAVTVPTLPAPAPAPAPAAAPAARPAEPASMLAPSGPAAVPVPLGRS